MENASAKLSTAILHPLFSLAQEWLQCTMMIKRLAEKLSTKQNLAHSVVSGWLQCRVSFALLRTTILCLRGTRRRRFDNDNNIELAVSAANIDY